MPGHAKRRDEAFPRWLEVVKLVNSGVPVKEIPGRIPVNPKTGKKYNIKTIYWILKVMRKS